MDTRTKANLRKVRAQVMYFDFISGIIKQLPILDKAVVKSCEWTFTGCQSEGSMTAPNGTIARYNRWNTINEICEIANSIA